MSYPIFAPSSTWYSQGGTTVEKATFTEITILDSYTPTGEESESWNADVNNNGDIKCYIKDKTLIIAGNGSGKLALNEDSSYMFSDVLSDGTNNNSFKFVLHINGLDILDTSNSKNMSYMFLRCKNLQSILINNWNTGNCENFSHMFYYCSSLSEINLTNFNTDNCKDFSSMFHVCGSLSEIDLTNFNTKKATKMSYMFGSMFRLKKVTLGSNFNFSGNGTASPTAILPTPSDRYITGTDGLWHSENCITYTSDSIPNETKMTYYAIPAEVPTIMTIKYGSMFNIAESYRQRAVVKERVSPSALVSGIKGIPGFRTLDNAFYREIDSNGYLIINDGDIQRHIENVIYIVAHFDGDTNTEYIMTHDVQNEFFYFTYISSSNNGISFTTATESAIIGSSNSISWPIDPSLLKTGQRVWITTIGYII